VQQQIAMIERMTSRNCDGLILTPDQPIALMVPVQRALAAGVPTVVLGSSLSIPPQPKLTYILNDDELTGSMGAMRIGRILNGKGSVAVVGIDPQSLSSLAILRSFELVLEKRFPAISITDRQVGASNDIDSELVINQLLRSQPDIDAIFSLDSIGTMGAHLALKDFSLTNRIKLVGVEQSVELANLIRGHQLDSLIAENTYQMGYEAVELLDGKLAGHPRLIKLPPVLITAENVDAPETKKLITDGWWAVHP
jgi:ribose transport system substrate-binding protein